MEINFSKVELSIRNKYVYAILNNHFYLFLYLIATFERSVTSRAPISKMCSFNFLIFLAVCLNISTVINIKILTNSNQQTSHIAAFLSVVLITEMLEICMQTSKRSTDFKTLFPCSVWYPFKRQMYAG